MNHATRLMLAALGLICLGVWPATADVGTLTLSGWLAGGGGTYVNARFDGAGSQSPQTEEGLFGTGSILGHFEDELPGGPLYCLDIFHTFDDVTTSWEVERMVVPPDPPYPPPWNTNAVAYAYHTFKHYSYSNNKAAGLQLALWEISHEQDWYSHFTYDGWFLESDPGYDSEFWVSGIDTNQYSKGYYASEILYQVHNAQSDWNTARKLYYYDPGLENPEYQGAQGFIGDIPEPGTALMLGSAILAGAGLLWRRRRS